MNTPVKTKQELIEKIQNGQQQIRNYGIKRLGIFGSFVHDQANENSDIDFLSLRQLWTF